LQTKSADGDRWNYWKVRFWIVTKNLILECLWDIWDLYGVESVWEVSFE
jgi:hypothetical protein